MNSDDDESSERDEMDDDSSGEDGDEDDNDDDDNDDDDDDDSSLGSDDEEINYEIVDDLSGEDSDEEESDNDDDDDDGISDKEIEYMETFIRTFHNGNYDKEFEAALSFDRGVTTFPVRPTQVSYNKPDDWVERNQIGLEKVKKKLEYCIRLAIQKLSFNLDLRHNMPMGTTTHGWRGPIVWHEQILDECWDQLEDTLSGDELVTNICNIHVENVEMKKERLATLVAILISGRATNSSTMFKFDNANICAEGIISLSKLVDVSTTLQRFSISHNQIDSIESARCLSRSLRSHARINQLTISYCDLGSSPEILSVILQSDVEHIYLEHNNIESLGAAKIAQYLEDDPPIRRIDLDHNLLNDGDIILISQALKRNTNLLTLFLHSNNFTSIGVKALLSCVFDGSSLNAISESNHTLTKIYLFSPVRASDTKSCTNRMLEMNRAQKIKLALQDKDSLLQYFANVPVELIPDVLALHHGRGVDEHQHKQLNIVYSTMPWWNMPLLYSHHKLCSATISDTKRKRDN